MAPCKTDDLQSCATMRNILNAFVFQLSSRSRFRISDDISLVIFSILALSSIALPSTQPSTMTKQSAWVSKIIKNEGLRLIPTDIIEEGLKQARETLRSIAAMDPDGEKKKIVDAFTGTGIKPTQLEKYLGHDIGTIMPAEIAELRSMYRTIRDGEASWNDYMKIADQSEQDPNEQTPPDNVTNLLKDRNGPSLYSGNSKSQQLTPSDSTKKVEKQETKDTKQKSNGTAPPFGDGMNEDQLWELLKENVASAGVKTPESFSKIESFIHHNVEVAKKPISEALRVAINTKPNALMLKVTDWYARSQEASNQQSQLTDIPEPIAGLRKTPAWMASLNGTKSTLSGRINGTRCVPETVSKQALRHTFTNMKKSS